MCGAIAEDTGMLRRDDNGGTVELRKRKRKRVAGERGLNHMYEWRFIAKSLWVERVAVIRASQLRPLARASFLVVATIVLCVDFHDAIERRTTKRTAKHLVSHTGQDDGGLVEYTVHPLAGPDLARAVGTVKLFAMHARDVRIVERQCWNAHLLTVRHVALAGELLVRPSVHSALCGSAVCCGGVAVAHRSNS